MNDQLTTRLSRELHEQVDGWHDTPLTLSGVQGRARTIRRRRQAIGSGLVAAAVLAVAIPVGLALDTRSDSSDVPVAPSPTRMVDDAPTPRADGSFALDVLDLPQGEVPATGFIPLADGTLHTPEGVLPLPGSTSQVHRFGDGWIGLRGATNPEDTGYNVFQSLSEPVQVTGETAAAGLVVDEAGDRAAWVEVEGDRWTLVAAAPDQPLWRTEVGANTRPMGLLADGSVVFQTPDYETGETLFAVARADGSIAPFGEGMNYLDDASEASGLVSGQVSYDEPIGTACYRALDPVSDVTAFETCDFRPVSFSPDGTLVAGYSAYADGLGSPELVILDAVTGDPVVRWSSGRDRQSPATVQSVAWEDEDTVNATVTEGTQQVVVRAELDGTLERVSDRAEVTMSIAYWLPTAQTNQG